MIKTYKFTSKYTNKGKLLSLEKLAKEYKKYCNSLIPALITSFYKEGRISKYPAQLKTSILSERYKQVCGQQVRGLIKSWQGKGKEKFKTFVYYSSLPEEQKKLLYTINKGNLWFAKSLIINGNEVPKETLKLVRKIFKRSISNRPALRSTSLCLDAKVARVEKGKDGGKFDYWIKLSSLSKGEPIYLPLKTYNYFEENKEKLKNFIQITNNSGKWHYGLISENSPVDNTGETILAMDMGLNNLVAIDTGELHGKKFIKLLQKYDFLIFHKRRNRQRLGEHTGSPLLKKNSKKLYELENQVKSLIKNEVGRILNKILDKYNPRAIVIEDLDLSLSKTPSRKVNRLLKRYGFGYIKEKLREKCEERGIELIEVNPAYTSQTCHCCGYVDENNRKSQSSFQCVYCGKKSNADINASRNILRRSQDEISIYTPYWKVKEILLKRFLSSVTPFHSSAHPLLSEGGHKGVGTRPTHYYRNTV
jgi:putative transposase